MLFAIVLHFKFGFLILPKYVWLFIKANNIGLHILTGLPIKDRTS